MKNRLGFKRTKDGYRFNMKSIFMTSTDAIEKFLDKAYERGRRDHEKEVEKKSKKLMKQFGI